MPTNFNLAPISASDASAEPFEQQLFAPDVVILMCGSRTWFDDWQVIAELKRLQVRYGTRLVIRHGDEPNGADRIISRLCAELRIRHEEYCATTPAVYERGRCKVVQVSDWAVDGKAAGPKRNAAMLEPNDVVGVVAFRSHGKSNGTDGMCNLARASGVPVIVRND